MIWLSLLGGLATGQLASNTELTIYNQGFALVKEVRELSLSAGRQSLAIEDVAALIETNSVGVRLIGGTPFQVLEQNYQFDLISVQAILNKAVGKKVTFNRVHPDGSKERIVGTLVSSPTSIVNPGVSDPNAGYNWGSYGMPGGSTMTYNGMVVRTDDGRILLNPTGEIEVAEIPEGLISKPTLMWEIEAARAGRSNVELSYLTNGVTWNSDYVLTIAEDAPGAMQGWVTLSNQSGRTYADATLKLLAGDVNRVQPARPGGMARGGFGGAAMDMAMGKQFEQESLFEYHLYTLQRKTTVRDKETKQVSLLASNQVKTTKKLILDPLRSMGMYYPGEGEVGTGELKPQVRVEFENTEANALGIPLPKGKVKVYQRDKSGSVQMIGEDSIDHTPKNEKLSLVVGRSFDIRADRLRTNFERLGPRSTRESFSIEIRNRKDVPETVHLYERRWGDWTVTRSSMDFAKLDSNTMEFVVTLEAGESKTVTYTVETKW